MKTKKILIAGAITLTALLIIHIVKRKKAEKKRLSVVAEEGYETAEDILFPKESSFGWVKPGSLLKLIIYYQSIYYRC